MAKHSALPAGGHLRRSMKFRDLVLFYITAVVGLRWIARAAEEGPSGLVIWAIACIAFFVPLAFTVLELSSRHPEEGGVYVWTKRAFGDFAGFMTGWLYWASNLVYFPGLLYFAAGNLLFVSDDLQRRHSENATYFMAFALGGLALAVVTNILGLRVGKWVANLGAISTWALVLTVIVMGAVRLFSSGSATPFSAGALVPDVRGDEGIAWENIVFWSTIAFAFGGLESASTMAEEVQDARRTFPRAIVVAGIAITALYVLGTLAILVAIPAESVSGIQAVMQAVTATTREAGVGFVAPAFAVLLAVASLGTVTAWTAATARLPFVAGIDNFLPRAFGLLHPKYGSPYVALVVQGVLAALFAVLGQAGTTVKGAYDVLVSMGVIAYFIPYALMFAAMVRAQREPAGPGVVRVPGGPKVGRLVAVVGLTTTVVSIVLACLPPKGSEEPSLEVLKIVGGSLLLVVAGAIIYFVGTGGRKRERWRPRKRKAKRRRGRR